MQIPIERGPFEGRKIEVSDDVAEGEEISAKLDDRPCFVQIETRGDKRVALFIGFA